MVWSKDAKEKFFSNNFFRVSVKGICVRDGKVLLVKESNKRSGKWELPGGGLGHEEHLILAFVREIEEEMGVRVTKISDSPICAWTHKFENDARGLGVYHSFVVAYRVEFDSLDFKKSDECEEVRFFSLEELKDLPLCGQTNEFPDIFKNLNLSDTF